jgi:DNA invertase Pin-like site-specific DNA recombinase
MTKVFAYLRVSTLQQVEGDGFTRQSDAITRFAEAKGWLVVRTFKEQQSGSNEHTDRKQCREMIELAGEDSATGVTIVIVERADRIARDLIVQELFLKDCRARGIQVYAADSGEELVNAEGDPTRTLIRQILGALSQWVKTETVKKLQAGRRRVALTTGQPCGGPKAYGKRGVPGEAAVLEDIKMYRASGLTLLEISRLLTQTGYPTPNRSVHGWTKSTVSAVMMKHKSFFEPPVAVS